MTTTHALHAIPSSTTTLARAPAAVRAFRLQAGVMTAIVLAFSVGFVATFGAIGLFVMALSLPVALLFLWASTDVVRSDSVSS